MASEDPVGPAMLKYLRGRKFDTPDLLGLAGWAIAATFNAPMEDGEFPSVIPLERSDRTGSVTDTVSGYGASPLTLCTLIRGAVLARADSLGLSLFLVPPLISSR